jgi:abnormal spindle-like microcephaly-associated protein
MSRLSIATPCPPDPHLVRPFRLSDLSTNCDDATGELEYTTELKAHIRQAVPRKFPRQQHRRASRSQDFDIYEDGHRPLDPSKPAATRRASILSHPAQKPNNRRNSITAPPVRRRLSGVVGSGMLDLSITHPSDPRGPAPIPEEQEVTHYKPAFVEKPARRRTIYVPSEDTTVMTIHPGAPSQRHGRQKSPDFGLDLVTLSEEDTESLKPAIRQKKESRKSFAVPPKRPLKTSRNSLAPNLPMASVPGPQTGKENVPPGKPELGVFKPRRFSLLPSETVSSGASSHTQQSHPRAVAVKPRRVSMLVGPKPSVMYVYDFISYDPQLCFQIF